jgi:adenylate cyclase
MTRPARHFGDGFRSLESRIVVFFFVLLLVVQAAGFFAIRYAIEKSARTNLRGELAVGERVFKRLREENSQQLVEATAVLTYDFAFRNAVASQDSGTILSALTNHSERIRASGMALVNLSNVIVADSMRLDNEGKAFAFPELIDAARSARDGRRASALRIIDNTIYQIVVVPVLAPLPIAWVAMYFVIDDKTAEDLKRITSLDVTFMRKREGFDADIFATTLTPILRKALLEATGEIFAGKTTRASHLLGGEEFEMLLTDLDRQDATRVVAILQRSVREGMQPYDGLQVALLFLAALSLGISLFGSVRIARRVVRPVTVLAGAANRISRGDYVNVEQLAPGVVQQNDEIGKLAAAFDNMSKGLAERDKMRDVLGKVTSPAVAERMLGTQVALGGEEREVTVLFADIRNFTSICESLTPQESVTLLNRYLECISSVIDRHEGVIDKYIGDGVMALFGAPVGDATDASRAVRGALAMVSEVEALGKRLAEEGLPHPEIGVGVNTARVIAGNIGSVTRLNYTVLGDGVNLAARLEGLTKRYQVPVIVGEATRREVPEFAYVELDRVRVKGKTVPVSIATPLARADAITADVRAHLATWNGALAAFRARRWDEADTAFAALTSTAPFARAATLHLGYLRDFRDAAPPPNWDGAFTLYEK